MIPTDFYVFYALEILKTFYNLLKLWYHTETGVFMSDKIKIVYRGGEGEIVEKKSRFIAYVKPVNSEEEAAIFIDSIKKMNWNAKHNCSAAVVGENNEFTRCNDDGEPASTAGKPMLEVLINEGVHNVAVVVTRYFGGTLLGTGGLVRAYTSAALGALESAEIIRYDIYSTIMFAVSYSDYGKISTILSDFGFRVEDTTYDTGVTISGRIIKSNLDDLKKQLVETTAGRVEIEIIGEEFGF